MTVPDVRDRLEPLLLTGLVATCGIVDLEVGYSARNAHNRLAIPDLLIAAAAEHAGLSVLHYDADLERIAEVTGQRHRWVVPRGSL